VREKWQKNSKEETSFVIPELQFILGRPENVGLFAGAVLCRHPISVSIAACSVFARFLVAYEEVGGTR
jgi:hypothetical protein